MNKNLLVALMGIVLIIIAILFISVANSNNNTDAKGELKVVATTTQLYDFAKNILGDKVILSPVMKADVDPHEFEPTPGDIELISNADLILLNGLGLEKNLDKSINESNAVKLNASNNVEVLSGEGEEESTGDPHIWFSVENAKKISSALTAQVESLDPTNAQYYEDNKDNYLTQLDNLDAYIKVQIDTLPEDKRKVVTNHDAFGYYIKAYNLVFVGSIIPSLSTEDQPTSSETSELIEKIKEQNVKAIFTESSISTKLADQIANEAGAKVVSTLYGDTLGEAGSNGDTYIKMMMYNTDEIVKALK